MFVNVSTRDVLTHKAASFVFAHFFKLLCKDSPQWPQKLRNL